MGLFTKRVGPRWRLLAALISGGLFVTMGNVLMPLADPLLPEAAPAWVQFSVFVVGAIGIAVALAGTTNAINIIDGFHGLATGSLIIMSITIASLAAAAGDPALAQVAIMFAATMAGFLVVNFPYGHLFLGDGGAYGAGFTIGALALLLAARTDVSAFVSILILALPVYETLFSIFRRAKRGRSPTQPDRVHLHALVSRSLARRLARQRVQKDLKIPSRAGSCGVGASWRPSSRSWRNRPISVVLSGS